METINNFCVYKHTSPSNKCYIGITKQIPEERWGSNGNRYMIIKRDGSYKHPYFANAILKYGWDNITHEILDAELTKEEACILEKKYISFYKSIKKSYNITDGGEGSSGFKFSKETKKRLSDLRKGTKQSEETIAKRVAKNTGKIRTDEQKSKTSKSVQQYDLHGNFIMEYFGIREASKQTGINAAHIGDCCNKTVNRKSAGGFMWKFKDDKIEIKPLYKEHHSRKKVIQYDIFGNSKIWESMKDIINECNISRYKLQKYCKEEIKDENGNIWKFF